MKIDVEHVVPLSQQAADVFYRAYALRLANDDLVFPGVTEGGILSGMALLQLVHGMRHDVTVHEFRSSFRG